MTAEQRFEVKHKAKLIKSALSQNVAGEIKTYVENPHAVVKELENLGMLVHFYETDKKHIWEVTRLVEETELDFFWNAN